MHVSNKIPLLQSNDFKLIVLEAKETSFVTKPPDIVRKENFYQTFLYLKSWAVIDFLGLVIRLSNRNCYFGSSNRAWKAIKLSWSIVTII